ncbi:MAG: hypothetical protein Q8M17_10630 [Actinomycetota bacterium]|nr:hypothetical protein [Actinomycetota bacterium]
MSEKGHDALCPSAEVCYEGRGWLCEVIAEVRADERAGILNATMSAARIARATGYVEGLAAAAALIRANVAADPTLSRTITAPATGEADVWGQGWACLREADRIDAMKDGA